MIRELVDLSARGPSHLLYQAVNGGQTTAPRSGSFTLRNGAGTLSITPRHKIRNPPQKSIRNPRNRATAYHKTQTPWRLPLFFCSSSFDLDRLLLNSVCSLYSPYLYHAYIIYIREIWCREEQQQKTKCTYIKYRETAAAVQVHNFVTHLRRRSMARLM